MYIHLMVMSMCGVYSLYFQTDAKRFAKVLSQVTGKRLTYAELTGREASVAF